MSKKVLSSVVTLTILLTVVLSAAQHIVPSDNGYFYTDSLRSKIYHTDGKNVSTVLTGPGVGYFTLSPDHRTIGFKFMDTPGGLESPALLDIQTGDVTLLHKPVACAGQVTFSQNGTIAYTIDNVLYVIDNEQEKTYDLNDYSNNVPLSPDGKTVVYNDADDQLWILDLISGNRQKITSSSYGHAFPSWSPDSRYVAFGRFDGMLQIYDRTTGVTKDLGIGGELIWASDRNEASYTLLEINEEGNLSNTNIVLYNADMGTLRETQTKTENEHTPFITTEGSVAYMTGDAIGSMSEGKSLKKISLTGMNFEIAPQTFHQAAPATGSYLDVPYIHQVYDTPGPRGYSSCGPTTAAMVLASYGLLPKWPFVSGFGNTNNYGAYVHEKYYYNETNFNLKYTDCNSAGTTCYTCYGGMGYMWSSGSPNSRMASYYNKHGVSTQQTWSTAWSTVAAEIDKKQPYSICNYLSSSGHLIAAKGRTDNGQRTVIVNDPYGDRNQASWPNYYGETVLYDWPGYNNGHASLNYANSGVMVMPWCIATSYTAPAVIDSIVDDKQFNNGFYIKALGNTVPMSYYHSSNTGFGGHHWWTTTETGQSDVCYVTWTPRVENGYYEIKAYIPAAATATSAVYRIHHAAGIRTVIVDQSVYADTLVSLGKYLMVNDGSNYVYLGDSTDVSGETLAFDAMVWTPAESTLDFVSDHTHGIVDYNVTFRVQSDLPIGDYSYQWNFGDGASLTGETVLHAYADTGSYTVTLTVEANGASIVKTHPDMISIGLNTYSGTEIVTVFPESMATVNTTKPTFVWENQNESTLLLISETPEFDSPCFAVMTLKNMISMEDALTENKTYYWKLVSGSNSSKVWAFQINAENSLPQSFDLTLPENEAITDTLRPHFEWSSTLDPDPGDVVTYRLYVGTHDSMQCIYEGNGTSYTMDSDLVENNYYNWYVEAVDAAFATRRSSDALRTFAVNTVNEAPPAPQLIAPNHNSYQTTRYPYLEWSSVQDPDPGDKVSYKVFYWTATSSSPNVINTTQHYYDDRRFSDMREYFWTVAAVDEHDLYTYSDTNTFYTNTKLDVMEIPEAFALGTNYPNPFNPETRITFQLPVEAFVELAIYELSGKKVETLVKGNYSAGAYSVDFNASGLPSGIYLYRINAGDYSESKKMLFLK